MIWILTAVALFLYAIVLVFRSPRRRQYFTDDSIESRIYGSTELEPGDGKVWDYWGAAGLTLLAIFALIALALSRQ